jgi:endoglycosylceramidase
MRCLLPALIATTACATAPQPQAAVQGPLSVADGRMVDALGREVLLRGVNARVRGLFDVTFDDGRQELETIPVFTGDDCAFLSTQLGLDALRLPVNWSAVEPVRGEYDQDYLDAITTLVDACAAANVWVLVDLHQDAFSKEIGEDGAPLWAIQPPLTPDQLLEGPLDDLGERRMSGVVLTAFESLWSDVDGLVGAYADMAAHLAAAIDGHEGVAGLELMNEPVIFSSPERLDTFHARVGEAVAAAAPTLPIFFEPNSIRNLVDVAPVNTPVPFGNAVYAPHVYTDVFEDGWASEDELAVRQSVAAARDEANQHDAALFVGEFGADPSSERGNHYTRTALDAYDDVVAGWAYWVYEEQSQGSWGLYDPPVDGGARGALRAAPSDVLARPYPRAVDGRVASIAWDGDAKRLAIGLAGAGEGLHQVSKPARTWPDAVRATCDGEPAEVTDRGAWVDVACAGAKLVVEPG